MNESKASRGEPGGRRFSLGVGRLARVDGWGMAVGSLGYMFRPRGPEEIEEVYGLARANGLSIGLRGGGNSYGDAAINDGGIVLDLSGMNRILSWDSDSGVIDMEPGVTIEQLWKRVIVDGYWPPVVSGTMFTTIGGCAAMNIHGKNNFKQGPFGEHILDFDILLPNGELRTCSRDENSELFFGAISGFGMLGTFTRIRMKMKKVHSGMVRVEALATFTVGEMIEEFKERLDDADYLVGWIDCIAGRRMLGRGVIHQANYLRPGEDPNPRETQRISNQELPDKLLGVFPKSLMYLCLTPLNNNLGMRLVNTAKFWSTFLMPRGAIYLQSHAEFAFLLDYVPNWKWAYRPGGLIQYQSFIPSENAERVFEAQIRLSKEAGLPPYLGVFKKHRPDPFLMTHAVDGYSLALDYKVTSRNRERLWTLCNWLDRIVLDAGGRFYFAKDATLRAESVRRFLPEDHLRRFLDLKKECDPELLLQTDLSRRLFENEFSPT